MYERMHTHSYYHTQHRCMCVQTHECIRVWTDTSDSINEIAEYKLSCAYLVGVYGWYTQVKPFRHNYWGWGLAAWSLLSVFRAGADIIIMIMIIIIIITNIIIIIISSRRSSRSYSGLSAGAPDRSCHRLRSSGMWCLRMWCLIISILIIINACVYIYIYIILYARIIYIFMFIIIMIRWFTLSYT